MLRFYQAFVLSLEPTQQANLQSRRSCPVGRQQMFCGGGICICCLGAQNWVNWHWKYHTLRHLFVSSMNLELLWWMPVIVGGSLSPRNSYKLRSYHLAIYEAITRAHCQALLWYQNDIFHPQLLAATEYRWKEVGDRLVPVSTRGSIASACITYLIKCGCKKTSCMSHCSCRSQHLNCAEMSMCGADEKVCSNVSQELSRIDDDDDYDPDIQPWDTECIILCYLLWASRKNYGWRMLNKQF